MSSNGHFLDTEYKGTAASPPPGKPDLASIQTILNTAKSIGYQGITDINLEPKHKKEGFDPIPLCIPEVTSLLESLGMRVYTGGGDSGNSEAANKTNEAIENVKNTMNEASDFVGKIGSGISSLTSGSSSSGTSSSDSSSSSDASSIASTIVNNLSMMKFLNFSAIDVESKVSTSRSDKLTANPEAIVTQASMDQAISESQSKLSQFQTRFATLVSELITNIQKYPDQLKAQSSSALTHLQSANIKTQLLSSATTTAYSTDFASSKDSASDLPDEWKP